MKIEVAGDGVLTDAITHVLGVLCTSTTRRDERAASCGGDPTPDAIVLVVRPAFAESDAIAWLFARRSQRLWEGHLVLACRSAGQRARLERLRLGDGKFGRALAAMPGHAVLGPAIRVVALVREANGFGLQAETWRAACRGPAVLARSRIVIAGLLKGARAGTWTLQDLATWEATRVEIASVGLTSLFPAHEELARANRLLGVPAGADTALAVQDLLTAVSELLGRSPWSLPAVVRCDSQEAAVSGMKEKPE